MHNISAKMPTVKSMQPECSQFEKHASQWLHLLNVEQGEFSSINRIRIHSNAYHHLRYGCFIASLNKLLLVVVLMISIICSIINRPSLSQLQICGLRSLVNFHSG